ncbi:MAG: RNA polymerase sigma-70 factor (ECF subfamily) [Salibacteraceae bacterium]|jgi:RNA polymerase sigma-70 factor (ECF subfamily)
MMNGICLRYASNKVEAEDVLQDAFVKAFKNLSAYSGQGPLGAWLRKIAVNTALEQYRKNKSLKNFGRMIDITETKLEIDDNAIEQLELEDLLAKIQNLPSGFRTVFNLYAVEGYTHKEIGELLGVSDGTSKSQYSRARVILRDMIQQEVELEQKKLNYAK